MGIIDAGAIFNKVDQENFDELINEIKGMDKDSLNEFASNVSTQILALFLEAYSDQEKAVEMAIYFFIFATELGCTGIKKINAEKKCAIMKFTEQYESISYNLEDDICYDGDSQILKDNYENLIGWLHIGGDYSPVPKLFYSYMLSVACAYEINEDGIGAVRKLRKDFLATK